MGKKFFIEQSVKLHKNGGFNYERSDGSFTFSFSNAMPSDSFKPRSSSITVTAKATSSNTSYNKYTITLYKYGTGDDIRIGEASYTADGKSYSHTFKNLDESASYYLYFTKLLLIDMTITGSGQVSPIQK